MLQFDKFKKSYGKYPALQIPDLYLEDGIFWIKGVNGSGKSTLLKSVAGILAFEGDVLLNKVSLKKQPVEFRQLVNFAEAEPLFPEFLTGKEMIRLFAAAKNAPAGQEQPYLESMGMEQYIGRPVGSYSSGMLKKLSLLLAFLGRPKLILLDEPLITIDVAAVDVLYHWIADHHRQFGTSFILSSHQTLEYADLRTHELLVHNQTLQFVL